MRMRENENHSQPKKRDGSLKEKSTLYSRLKAENEIISDEGVVHAIYEDHLGHPTFGIGHLITPKDPEYGLPINTPVSEERVLQVFRSDMEQVERDCIGLYGFVPFNSFPDEVQCILLNMMFNLGYTKLSKFVKMNAAIDRTDWKEAAKEGRDSRWYRQVTNRAERLMSRLEKVS